MPCPLCLLGVPDPHTKEDWARLSVDAQWQAELDQLYGARPVSDDPEVYR